MRILTGSGFSGYPYYLIIIILSLSLAFCNKYPEVRLNPDDPLNANNKEDQKSKVDEILSRYKIYSKTSKSYPVIYKINTISGRRYLINMFSGTPLAEINNKGVDYALMGRFEEAEVLFAEVVKEDKDYSPGYNNLGVVFELSGNESAFGMYSRACLLDPDNEYYRQNLLCFCDKK